MPYVIACVVIMGAVLWIASWFGPSDPQAKYDRYERMGRVPYSDVPRELRDPNERIFQKGEAGAVRDMNDRATCTAVGGTRC